MTPIEKQVIYNIIYQACLKAAQEMGDDIYKLSWFAQYHNGTVETEMFVHPEKSIEFINIDIDVSPNRED